MKVLEFQTHMNPDRTLTVPGEVAEQIAQEDPVRVVLLIADESDDADWNRLTAEQFAQGYADTDAIYDRLSTG